MKKALVFIYLLCFFSSVFARQNTEENIKIKDSINTLINLASNDINDNNFQSALYFATQAVDLSFELDDKNIKSEAYTCLGNSYQIAEDYMNSEKYFKLALSLGREVKNEYSIVAALNGLGNVQSSFYKNIDQAIAYFEEAASHTQKTRNEEAKFINAMNMSSMYLEYDRNANALKYIKLGEKYYKLIEEAPSVYKLTLDVNYADYYKNTKQYDQALLYYDKAFSIAKKDKYYTDIIDISQSKSEVYEAQGNLEKVIEELKIVQNNKYIYIDAENKKQLEAISTEFKVKEYEQELLVKDSKNKSNLLIALSILTGLILLFFFFYRFKSNKKKSQLKEKNIDLQAAKEKAEELTKLKSELLKNISHELRTPLYGVIGITAMLMEDKTVNKNHNKLLRSLQFSGDHLKNLVNNILRISDIQTKGIILQKTNVNLYNLVQNIVSSLQFQAEEKQNTLKLSIPKSLDKQYYIDGFRLSEVLINIISNAIKFTNEGEITVDITKDSIGLNNETIAFKITDTGIGIPYNKQDVIFENFKQAVQDENTSYGAGLGLPICKYLLGKMESQIHLTSEENKGTKVSFEIQFEVSDQQVEEAKLENSFKPLKVLVVEDNKINQMVTQKLILSIGHDCKIAENGIEAVKACEDDNFDLILMDLNMPIMNGFEASKEIKILKPSTKIVALTALEISEVKQRCFDLGMESIINKPISKNQLAEIIDINSVKSVG